MISPARFYLTPIAIILLILITIHVVMQLEIIPHNYAEVAIKIKNMDNSPIKDIPVVYCAESYYKEYITFFSFGFTKAQYFGYQKKVTSKAGFAKLENSRYWFRFSEIADIEIISINIPPAEENPKTLGEYYEWLSSQNSTVNQMYEGKILIVNAGKEYESALRESFSKNNIFAIEFLQRVPSEPLNLEITLKKVDSAPRHDR